ncbi:MAG: hypothetical protein LIO79_01515 [Rikenellaceae bacterium]|nr:hypothetical protein [Rikenellaceae bacterium]
MTTYQKEFIEVMCKKFRSKEIVKLLEILMSSGVVDDTMLKVFVIRKFVFSEASNGNSKLNAMWKATEHFCCSYEYVRKCIYYYKDVDHNIL